MNILIRERAGGAHVLDENALEQFQRQWSTYQKLVDADILSHKAVGELLHEAVAGQGDAFSFLDIACGDAHFMARRLGGTKISHYRGVDLSEPALLLARENLKDAPFAVELDHGDFVETLEKAPEPTDIAWCGLSIHHLQTNEKLNLLRAIRGATRRFLMIYEPTLLGGESREGYLRRFNASPELKAVLTEDEWRMIVRHVADCDFPEPPETWLTLGRDAGFAKSSEIFRDPTRFYRVYRYDC
jgi:SAM-dependent methyltransferase